MSDDKAEREHCEAVALEVYLACEGHEDGGAVIMRERAAARAEYEPNWRTACLALDALQAKHERLVAAACDLTALLRERLANEPPTEPETYEAYCEARLPIWSSPAQVTQIVERATADLITRLRVTEESLSKFQNALAEHELAAHSLPYGSAAVDALLVWCDGSEEVEAWEWLDGLVDRVAAVRASRGGK